jgi:hypothetical protein
MGCGSGSSVSFQSQQLKQHQPTQAPDDSITTSADAEKNKAITTTTTSATEETTHDAIHYNNG